MTLIAKYVTELHQAKSHRLCFSIDYDRITHMLF